MYTKRRVINQYERMGFETSLGRRRRRRKKKEQEKKKKRGRGREKGMSKIIRTVILEA